ncbi:MAG: hypothetical protein IPI67_17120 [Myxococcales bacterium]|nr:hypothetical protein [Myxococcales bacterium]
MRQDQRRLQPQAHAARRDLFAAESHLLVPLPAWRSPVYRIHTRLVDLESYVNVHTFRYEVPARYIGHQLEVRETKTEIQLFDGPRVVATHPRRVDGPASAAPRAGARRAQAAPRRAARRRGAPAARRAPELATWITELHRRAPRGRGVARLRQLRRLLRDYPQPPLIDALRDAARYGLYDLERIETTILRNIRHDYFPRRDPDDEQE